MTFTTLCWCSCRCKTFIQKDKTWILLAAWIPLFQTSSPRSSAWFSPSPEWGIMPAWSGFDCWHTDGLTSAWPFSLWETLGYLQPCPSQLCLAWLTSLMCSCWLGVLSEQRRAKKSRGCCLVSQKIASLFQLRVVSNT